MCLACLCALSTCCKGACKCCVCAGKLAIRLIRLSLFVFQFVFWAAGLALFGLGIYLAVDDPANHYEAIVSDLSSNLWDVAVGLIISLGIFIFIVGILGCCGTMKNDADMLCWYAVLMMVLLCVQISAGALVAVQADEIKKHLDNNMEKQIKNDYLGPDTEDELSKSWDNLQKDLECCAANSYQDYVGSNYTISTGYPVPWTCCVLDGHGHAINQTLCYNEAELSPAPATFVYLNDKGCYKKVTDWVDANATLCYIVIYSIAFLELLSVLLGFCMCCSVQESDEFQQ